jgi:transcriptional regulator with XRE-family HTH domain
MIAPADAPARPAGVPAVRDADVPADATTAALVRDAMDTLRLTREDIAARLDVKRGTLESYHYGTRRIPDDTRRRLAVLLTVQADELRRLAGALLEPDTARRLDAGG